MSDSERTKIRRRMIMRTLEDPIDYSADGGDDGDDEMDIEEDKDADMDIDEEDEDVEIDEEEHLAPAYPVVVALR
ncbi:hypothetical protein Tco_0123206 [Tanacetum coccineum]